MFLHLLDLISKTRKATDLSEVGGARPNGSVYQTLALEQHKQRDRTTSIWLFETF